MAQKNGEELKPFIEVGFAECSHCLSHVTDKKKLEDLDKMVAASVDNTMVFFFCSEDCLEEYMAQMRKAKLIE